jgi:hypothetical protein
MPSEGQGGATNASVVLLALGAALSLMIIAASVILAIWIWLLDLNRALVVIPALVLVASISGVATATSGLVQAIRK